MDQTTTAVLSRPTGQPDSTPQFEADAQSEATVHQDANQHSEMTLPYDVAQQSDATSQSENTIQSEVGSHSAEDSSSRSSFSVSLAAATISENESFGLDSTNDEASAGPELTIQSSCTVEEEITETGNTGKVLPGLFVRESESEEWTEKDKATEIASEETEVMETLSLSLVLVMAWAGNQ